MIIKLISRNFLISTSLMGLGDITAQYIEKDVYSYIDIDYNRCLHFSLLSGLSNGVGLTFWYRFLNNRFPNYIYKRILCDEICFAPISISSYICLSNYLNNKNLLHDYNNIFLNIWSKDIYVWPTSNYINFKYIPLNYQPLWTSMISVSWNVFVSYTSNN